jgi:hypothetical protein
MYNASRIILGAIVLAGAVACSDAALPTAPTHASFASGGGGGAGIPPVAAACSPIKTFSVTGGQFPNQHYWGAIWSTVSVASCDPASPVTAVLTARETGVKNGLEFLLPFGSPDTSVTTWVAPFAAVANVKPTVYDFEPVALDSPFDVQLEVFDAQGVSIASRRVSVRTPVLKHNCAC